MSGSTITITGTTPLGPPDGDIDGVVAVHGVIRVDRTTIELVGREEAAIRLTGGESGDSAAIRANRFNLSDYAYPQFGIWAYDPAPALTVAGNTIVLLSGGPGAAAIWATTAEPIVANNLVMCTSCGQGMYLGEPIAVYANAFVGLFGSFYGSSGTDPNSPLGTLQPSENVAYATPFQAGIPTTGPVPHPENLSATSPLVGAGHNPDALDCGGQLCGGALNDINDRPRPQKPTIGANEPL